VYNDGDDLKEATSERTRKCLSSKSHTWHRKRYQRWIWNIWPDQSNWNDPRFLMRIADEREIVVAEVANSMVKVIEFVDEALTDARKPHRKRKA